LGDSGLGTFLSILGAGIALISGPAGWGIYGVLAGMGVSAIGGMVSQAEMRKNAEEALQRAKDAMAGLRVNTRTQLKSIPVIYGRARVGGNIVYMRSTGASNSDLHLLWGIGEGPIDGFEQMWFNDVLVWDVAKIGVNSGILETPYKGKFLFDYRLGTNVQSRFEQIYSIDPDFNDKYPLVAMTYLKLTYAAEVYQGIPRVNWVIRGRVLSRPWDTGSAWSCSPPLVVYDQMVHPRYGLGVSTTAVNCASWVAANSYAMEAPPIVDKWIEEGVDQSAFGPKKFSETIPYHTLVGPEDTYIGATANIGGTEGVKLPIRPGSLALRSWSVTDEGAMNDYLYFSDSAGAFPMSATTGTIVLSGGSTVGSVDYYTGKIGVSGVNYSLEATWFGGYGVVFRTKYQYIARSLSLRCGSETLVETGTITSTGYLISSQGGYGFVDYLNGIVDARLGGSDWFDFSAATVRYKVSSLSLHRFTFNGGYVDASPVLDQVRDSLSHMRAFLVYAAGEYKLKIEKPGGSIFSFGDDNIVAGTFKVMLPPLKDKPNRIRVKYVDALEAYTPKDAVYEVGSPADVQGLDREQTIVLPSCAYRDQAHRIAQTAANAAMFGTTISFETKADAIDLEPGDIIDVTHPACAWSGKLFRVWYVSLRHDEKVEIRAMEHDDSIYADSWPYGDMTTVNPSALPRRSYFAPAVTSLTLQGVLQTLSDGTTAPGIRMKVEATSGTMVPAGYRFFVQYETASRAPFVAYEGPKPEFTLAPLINGFYTVAAYTYSDWGIQGNMGLSRTIEFIGRPEFEWQMWRVQMQEPNIRVGSLDIGCECRIVKNALNVVGGGTYAPPSGFGSSTAVTLRKIVAGMEQVTTIVGSYSRVYDFYYPTLAVASGDNLAVFYTQSYAALNPFMKVLDPVTHTLVRTGSPMNLSIPIISAAVIPSFCSRSWDMFMVGVYSDTASNAKVGYMPLSMSGASSLYSASSWSHLFTVDIFTDAVGGLSAFFTNSYFYVAYGAVNSRMVASGAARLDWAGTRIWKWDRAIQSLYIGGSMTWVKSGLQNTDYLGHVSAFYDNRITEVRPIWYSGSGTLLRGKFIVISDPANPTWEPRVYNQASDVTSYGHYVFGRPATTKDMIVPATAMAFETPSGMQYRIDIDVLSHWRISGITPSEYITYY